MIVEKLAKISVLTEVKSTKTPKVKKDKASNKKSVKTEDNNTKEEE